MKFIKKISTVILLAVCALIPNMVKVNASELSTMRGLNIDERMRCVKEIKDNTYNIKRYETYFNWGWHQHIIDCSTIKTSYGVYDYYNREEDRLVIFCWSWMDASIGKSVGHNRSSQNIRLNFNDKINNNYLTGKCFPMTQYSKSTATSTIGFSIGASETNGAEAGFTFSDSVTRDYNDVTFTISDPTDSDDKCTYGRQWNFEIHKNRESLYQNIVSYYFIIDDASTLSGESFDIKFGYWHEFKSGNAITDTKKDPNYINMQSAYNYKIEI